MDPIPRPWGLDLLPLAYTDFDIQVSHLICLLWIIPPAPADCRIAVHHHLPASRVPSWAVGSETTRPYPALPEGWGPLLWTYAQMKVFPMWFLWTKTVVGEAPLEK